MCSGGDLICMGNYDKYFEYKTEKIQNLSKLTKSELVEKLRDLNESVEEYKKYIKWDVELLILADDFRLTKDHRTGLVDTCVFQDGRKYPDFEHFEYERVEYYRKNLELAYSDEISARIYNYLIEKAKDGYLYVDEATEVMYRLTKASDIDQRRYLPRIIDLCIKYNHKNDLYKNVIVDLKKYFKSEIDNSSPFAAFYLNLYDIAVFVKKDVLDTDEEVKSLIQKVIDSVDDYVLINAYGSELLLSNALNISRELKNSDLVESVIHKSIESRIYVGDQAFASEDYYMAVEYYEKAAHISNQEGFLSRMNYIMAQIKVCYTKIGKSIEETIVKIPVPYAKELEENLSKLISGKPEMDFHTVCAALIASVIDDHNSFFPSMSESRDRALNRYQANPFWQFIAVSKMSDDRKLVEGKNEGDTVELFAYEDYVTHIKLWSSLWMESIIGKLISEGLDREQVADQLCSSLWLSDTNIFLIREAVQLLFEGRYAGFMHIAVPTYESIFRRLFGYHDISTTVLSMQDNSQKERIFGEFLSMQIVKDNIPKRLLEMTKVVFTEQLGLNLRNNIAHGLCEIRDFEKNDAYIVLGMLILITRFDWIDYQRELNDLGT